MGTSDLYLVRMELPMAGVVGLARRRGFPLARLDEGHAVHCALGELFRDKAPKPFHLPGPKARRRRPGTLEVHAYSRVSKTELITSAEAFGDVALHDGFDRTSLQERKLPDRLPAEIGFTVRLCPVVRLCREVDIDVEVEVPGDEAPVRIQIQRRTSGAKQRGREVDAFEAARIQSHLAGRGFVASERRTEIYLDWFDRLAAGKAGIEVLSRRLLARRWLQLYRRSAGGHREGRKLCRPEIVVGGRLRITEQDQFRGLLGHGLGRHKSFGFGMLMLRPASEA